MLGKLGLVVALFGLGLSGCALEHAEGAAADEADLAAGYRYHCTASSGLELPSS